MRSAVVVFGLLSAVGRVYAQEDTHKPARVTFDEAVRMAIQSNPSMAVASQTVARAEALLTQARAGYFPTVTGNATYTRLDDARTLTSGSSTRVVAGRDQIQANVQVTVPLLAPQPLAAAHRAEDARAVAQAAAIDVRRQVAIAAARAWLSVVSQTRLVQAAEHARASARAHHEYALGRLQGGVGRSLDEVRAGQERAVAEAQAESALTAVARAKEALGVMIAADGPVDAATDDGGGPAVLAQGPPTLADGLGAVESRRDVAAARARYTAAEQAKRDRWAFYSPYVAAVATPFYQNPASLVNPELGWQAQLVFNLPIYDGGRRGGVFREQEATIAESHAQLNAQLRQARAEVRVAFEVLMHADRALEASRQSAALAKRSLELATIAYQAGATTNLEVIDAERRARDAETALAVAEDTARQARLELLAAAGRFPAD